MEFTKENLQTLRTLYTDLSFSEDVLEGKFGANMVNPWEIINAASVVSLRLLLKTLKGQKNQLNDLDSWSKTEDQSKLEKRLDTWYKFIDLTIGYKLDKEKNSAAEKTKQAEIRKLEDRIAAERDKNVTLGDLEEQLRKLKG
jgi:hypothetical protein